MTSMESVSKNDAQHKPMMTTSRGPNIITNAEEVKSSPSTAINFASYVIPEETKRKPPIEKMTFEQFSRKVHSKHNLLYALGINGKFPRFLKFITSSIT